GRPDIGARGRLPHRGGLDGPPRTANQDFDKHHPLVRLEAGNVIPQGRRRLIDRETAGLLAAVAMSALALAACAPRAPASAAPTPLPTPGLVTATTASALAAPAEAAVLGTWKGTYNCGQGVTGMTLDINQATDGTIDAAFNFYAVAANPTVPSGSGTLQ